MTLGSCVKGPNNMICRKWVWKKACYWVLGRGLIRIFMEAHVEVNLACRAKPYMDGVWKVCLLGLSPSSISSSPAGNCVCKGFPLWASPFLQWYSSPFILVFSPVLHIRVSFSLFGVVTRLINPHVRVIGEELDSMVWVWVCQAMGSTLRCWQHFPWCCSCAESVLFFGRFVRCRA